MKNLKIMTAAIKLSSLAVLADLIYIITRISRTAETLNDASFIAAAPEMLEHMLLSAAVIMLFGALSSYVIRSGDELS